MLTAVLLLIGVAIVVLLITGPTLWKEIGVRPRHGQTTE